MRQNKVAESQRDGRRELRLRLRARARARARARGYRRMRWLAPIWLAGPRYGRPGKRHALRFSRGAAIGCSHGRQPMEWSVLNAPSPNGATRGPLPEIPVVRFEALVGRTLTLRARARGWEQAGSRRVRVIFGGPSQDSPHAPPALPFNRARARNGLKPASLRFQSRVVFNHERHESEKRNSGRGRASRCGFFTTDERGSTRIGGWGCSSKGCYP
jgi:hypothetical protein